MILTNQMSLIRSAVVCCLFATALGSVLPSMAGPITHGVKVTASSSEANTNKAASHIVDGSGLSETFPGSGILVHTNNPFVMGGSMWGSGYQPAGADHTPTLTFDLGKVYSLAGFHVWNYNEKNWTARGFRTVEVSSSLDGNTFTSNGTFTFEQADGTSDYEGEDIRLKAVVKARFVRFHALSTYRGDDVAGLSSVEFNAVGPDAPPERAKKVSAAANLKPKYPRPLLPKQVPGRTVPGAEDILFPKDSGVIDLSKDPYGVKGDGISDNTQAIQQALRDASSSGAILYLPNGVYLVSDTLKWPTVGANGNTSYGFETLQGQSMAGTVLRLKDRSFINPSRPKAVLGFGAHGSADYFANSVRNLTIDTGIGNPGADGLQFFSNNMGSVRDVTIQSGDGYGQVGLNLGYNDMNGPLLIKNLRVIGFDIGIRTGFGVNSQTLEHIRLQRQNQSGFVNNGQCISLRDLKSENVVSAVVNTGGLLTIVDSTLKGDGAAKGVPAIVNSAEIYVRNMDVMGYTQTVETTTREKSLGTLPHLAQFVSHPITNLFGRSIPMLDLPIRETPDVPWDPLEKWVSVEKFKQKDAKDDTAAIQAAIDSGATTVYFPHRNYKVSSTIFIRGNVRRIIGCTANVDVPESDSPGFKIVDGTAPVVVFERIDSGYSKATTLENASNRTLVVKDCTNVCGNMTGTGDVFLEDVCSNPFTNWQFGRQHVWARQFNVENQGTHVLNNGATLWILGLKTERGGTLIQTGKGAQTQVDGGLCYTTTGPEGAPMFINEEGAVSFALGEANFGSPPYKMIVREQRKGETKTLDTPDSPTGVRFFFYSGHP